MKLVDFFRGRMSLRELCLLIKQLRYGARIHDDWNQDQHLLASAIDCLSYLVWAKSKDASDGKKPPKPMRRPLDPEAEIVFTPTDQVLAMFGHPQ